MSHQLFLILRTLWVVPHIGLNDRHDHNQLSPLSDCGLSDRCSSTATVSRSDQARMTRALAIVSGRITGETPYRALTPFLYPSPDLAMRDGPVESSASALIPAADLRLRQPDYRDRRYGFIGRFTLPSMSVVFSPAPGGKKKAARARTRSERHP